MTHARHRLAIAAAALTAAALMTTGCQSEDSDSGGGGGDEAAALSLSGLTAIADDVPKDGADTCPLSYDIGAAAKAAGVDGEAGPVGADGDTPAATAEGGERAEAGEPLAENPGALVSCTFRIGADDVQVHTVATRDPSAITVLAPTISPLTGMSTDDAVDYVNTAAKADAGEVLVADSGNVATVRLKLDGSGDAALLVGAGEGGSASLERQQVEGLARALAEQVRVR
ncbi:hypothetical protein [Streptomyces sp. NPDC057877]|uniref:hypothetical protein n=1 Tax=Streptomyces sp. NPDC057877 TaxID=3346269 RepID=UPI0036B24D22